MDVWILILIICIVVFVLTFCILYHKKIRTFFKKIGGGLKAFFGLFKRNKVKLTKEQKKNRASKSEMQSRPVLLLPNATAKKEDKKVSENSEEKGTEKPKPNAVDIVKLGGKFVASNKDIIEEQNFESKKKAMQDDFEKFLEELEAGQNEEDDLDDIFGEEQEKIEQNQVVAKVKKNNSVKVDGEDVDLSKLPPKIRRLLLSGMLDRKDDD